MSGEAELVPVQTAAARIGVPRAWLKKEALAGRIPCLQAGSRILVDFAQVKQLLAKRVKLLAEGCDAQ